MKKVKVIHTELGEVPVIVAPVAEKGGDIHYNGTILGQNNIFIQTKSIATCLEQLKKAFELSMHFWLRQELHDLHLEYEGKIKKDWYNE